MRGKLSTAAVVVAAFTIGVGAPQGQGGRGNVAPALFSVTDANNDAAVTREEFKSSLEKVFSQADAAKAGTVSQDQLLAALNAALPQPPPPPGGGRGAGAQNQTPNPADVQAMMAALPEKAAVKPKQPRRVLVLGEGGRLRPLVDPAGRTHGRRDGQEDRARGRRPSPTTRRTSTSRT